MSVDAAPEKHKLQELRCQSCGSTLLAHADLLATICPYCASPSVLQRPPAPNRPIPTFTIGFALDQQQAVKLVKRWIGSSHWFARSDFKRAAPDLTRGVYLPAYLYSALAESTYSASIGENYTETETYRTTDSNGKRVTRTRTVTKTEWRPLNGNHACYVLDVIVTASQGVSNAALEAIEPFDLRGLRRYSAQLVSGWLAEEPSRDQSTCFDLAHSETKAKVGKRLKGFMPGDSHRNLQFHTELARETIDLALLPVWCFAVRYDETLPPVQILVNGQTGRVGGQVPVSKLKVSIVVVAVIGLLIGIVILLAAQS